MAKPKWCSFCGKADHEVDRLIAGPQVYACNECIDLMHGLIHDCTQPAPADPDATKSLVDFKKEAQKRGLLTK